MRSASARTAGTAPYFPHLALRLGQSPAMARDLLAAHHATYRPFWQWSDAAVDSAVLTGTISTAFGWTLHITESFNRMNDSLIA